MYKLKIFFVILLLSFSLFAVQNRLLFMGVVEKGSNLSVQQLYNIEKEIDADLFSNNILPLYTSQELKPYQAHIKQCAGNQKCLSNIAKRLNATLTVYAVVEAASTGLLKIQIIMIDNAGNEVVRTLKQGGVDKMKTLVKQSISELSKKTLFFMFEKKYKQVPSVPIVFKETSYDPTVRIVIVPNATKIPVINNQQPEALTSVPTIAINISQKEKTLFMEALRQDRLGETEKILSSWALFLSSAQNPQTKMWAEKRLKAWQTFIQINKARDSVLEALQYEKKMKMFPDKVLAHWKKISLQVKLPIYQQFLNKRIVAYKPEAEKIKQWQQAKRLLQHNEQRRVKEFKQAFSLKILSFEQKYTLLSQFMIHFSSVSGSESIKNLIEEVFTKDDRESMLFNLFNPLLAAKFSRECQGGDVNSCLVAADIYAELQNQKEYSRILALGCSKEINYHCSLDAKRYMQSDSKKAEKYTTESCLSIDAEGCFLLAELQPIPVKNMSGDYKLNLYERSCELGYKTACVIYADIKQQGYKKKVKQLVLQPQQQAKKTESGKVPPQEKQSFKKRHPYFWYGFPLLLGGIALGATSTYFFIDSNNSYKNYNELTDPVILQNLFDNGTAEEVLQYKKRVDSAQENADKSKIIAISTAATGGAMIITGIILMAVKPKKKDKSASFTLPVRLVVMPNGAFASITFQY